MSLAQRIEDEAKRIFAAVGEGSTKTLPEIYANLHRLIFDVGTLEHSWHEEHDARVRLEERLKSAEASADYWRQQALKHGEEE